MANDLSREGNPLVLPEAKLSLDERLDELDARIKVGEKTLDDVEEGDNGKLDLVPEAYQNALMRTYSAYSDEDWVVALRLSGLPDKRIVEIWNRKDVISSEERDEAK